MTFLGDVIFYWRDSGPNLLIGVVVTLIVGALGYVTCRNPKGRIAGIVVFGLWTVYVPSVFIGSKIWPEEVSISPEEIHGCHNFSRFSLKASDIHSIRLSRGGKGGYALHVFLKSKSHAVGIPVIWDKDKDAYKTALHNLSPDADLEW